MIEGKRAVSDDIDRNAEHLFSGDRELGDRQQPDGGRPRDEEIEITFRRVCAVDGGSEDANVAQSVVRGEVLDSLAVLLERFMGQGAHGGLQTFEHGRRRLPAAGLVGGDIGLRHTGARGELCLAEPRSLAPVPQCLTHIAMISPHRMVRKGARTIWPGARGRCHTVFMDLRITDDAAADRLLSDDPLALLIGMLLDQQVAMEVAFAGPLKIQQRLGTTDAAALAAVDPDDFAAAFSQPPAVHRFPGSMAGRVQALCRTIADDWGGDAAALWTRDDPDGATVLKRLKALPGFGDQKAKIFLALLGKQYGYDGAGWREAAGSYGEEGSYRSVADITSPESLTKVREYKRAMKAEAKK